MSRYIVRRCSQALLVIIGVVLLTFVVVRLVPGDPARLMLPLGAEEAEVDAMRQELGTDQSVPVQFGRYLQELARGDLGESFRDGRPVSEVLGAALPSTLLLASAALTASIVSTFGLGLAAALRRGTWVDRGVLAIAVAAQSLPTFYVGVLLVLLFSVNLGWLPALGNEGLRSLVLPATTLALAFVAILVRTVRQSMVQALSSDYVMTATAMGIPRPRVVLVYALKNAAIPLVTVVGLLAGAALSGAVAVEVIFEWPGVGLTAVKAFTNRDFPVVQGVVLVAGIAFVVVNLVVDLIYSLIDPRLRLSKDRA